MAEHAGHAQCVPDTAAAHQAALAALEAAEQEADRLQRAWRAASERLSALATTESAATGAANGALVAHFADGAEWPTKLLHRAAAASAEAATLRLLGEYCVRQQREARAALLEAQGRERLAAAAHLEALADESEAKARRKIAELAGAGISAVTVEGSAYQQIRRQAAVIARQGENYLSAAKDQRARPTGEEK